MTLKRVTCTSFPWNKGGDLGHQFYPQIWTEIRLQLHTQENALAMLHRNKEIFKLNKTPALNQS